MNLFWSRIVRELSPYVPGEQPRIANLVKLNTNESPFGLHHSHWKRCETRLLTHYGFIPIPRRQNCARCLPPITA
jgi:histidinol-phosphate/aromatic aminotransferase/cobyric acid decarboxylase-like protein